MSAPLDHAARRESIDQLNDGMMAELEAFGQRTDRRRLSTFETLDLEQEQIVLRLDARRAGDDLANAQEPANLISQIRERGVVETLASNRDGRLAERSHGRSVSLRDTVISFRDTHTPRPAVDSADM